MSPNQPLPPKKEVALALLERSSVHLHLDPRTDGVVVPPWLRKQPQLVLQVGLNMPVPIPDLRLDEDGLSCTLSFNRSPFFCVVPWSSVFAIVGDDQRGMVWPDDVPPEVAQQASAQVDAAARKEQPARRPVLEAVRAAPAPAPEAPPAKAKRGRKKQPAAGAEAGARAAATPKAAPTRPQAVPTPVAARIAPAPRHEEAEPREREREPAVSDKPRSPFRPQPSAPAARKPKRELPPYLRVVK